MSDTLYENYPTGEDDYTAFYDIIWVGQTFTIGNTGSNVNHNITSVKVKLYTGINPVTTDITISIRNTSGGLPTGDDLTSNTLAGSNLTITPTWFEIILPPYLLYQFHQYALILRCPGSTVLNPVRISKDESSPSYTGGACLSGDGSFWTAEPLSDYVFYEYGIEFVSIGKTLYMSTSRC